MLTNKKRSSFLFVPSIGTFFIVLFLLVSILYGVAESGSRKATGIGVVSSAKFGARLNKFNDNQITLHDSHQTESKSKSPSTTTTTSKARKLNDDHHHHSEIDTTTTMMTTKSSTTTSKPPLISSSLSPTIKKSNIIETVVRFSVANTTANIPTINDTDVIPVRIMFPKSKSLNMSGDLESMFSHLSNSYVMAQDQSSSFNQEGKYQRQPLMLDSMSAMSNELPPLTAALPMDLFNYQPNIHQISTPILESQLIEQPHGQTIIEPVQVLQQQSPVIVHQQQQQQPPVIIEQQSLPEHLNNQLSYGMVNDVTPGTIDDIAINRIIVQGNVGENKNLIENYFQYQENHNLKGGEQQDYGIAGIPGKPWVDYPIFSQIPRTQFHCNGNYGFFADMEAGCQVWHYCQPDGRHDAFLCSNGTLFNQLTRVCDWWYHVNCQSSGSKYGINLDLYQVPTKSTSSYTDIIRPYK